MEFKVIFAGFALHCVLNTVLLCKSVIAKGDDARAELAQVEKESREEVEMFDAIENVAGEVKSLSGSEAKPLPHK